MFTVRCTQKLLRRLGATSAAPSHAPSTVLGDWYANLYYTRPQQLVLCMSERSLLAVLVQARDGRHLADRIRASVVALLARLGVPRAAIDAEANAMREVFFGPTANRRVLGCLNEAAFALAARLEDAPRLTIEELEDFLSENIYSTTKYKPPLEVTMELFSAVAYSSVQ